MTPTQLIALWRSQAKNMERDGVTIAARVLERVAEELEAIAGGELVNQAEAVRRSGYTDTSLRRMTREGRLVNVGTKHRPRYRAADLPKKAGHAG